MPDLLHSPLPLGSVALVPVKNSRGAYRGSPKDPLPGETTCLVECEALEFELERYCRFVRPPGGGYPYTFSSMEFAAQPPGLRVGPWPGWRGIPDFPALTLTRGSSGVPMQVMWWGDEFQCHTLRYVATLVHDGKEDLIVTTPDLRIVPHHIVLYRTSTLRAHPVPVRLSPGMEDVHPRLLITPHDIPLLRTRARGSHASLWQGVLGLLQNRDLPFEKTTESKAVSGPERLTGEDRVLITACIATIETGDHHVREALEAYREYLEETRRPGFEPLGIDTQAGEVLFVLCAGYDWLYRHLSEEDRQKARARLEEVADICWNHLGYERRDYGQAHYLGCGLGLLAFSFLFWKEHPRAPEWAAHLRGVLDCVRRLLPNDGFFPHGINLWIYEFGFLLRWLELFRTCTGENSWPSTPALERVSNFRASTLSPDGLHGITFGDPQYRVGGDSWCHFLIASRTGSTRAQWLGTFLQNLPHAGVDIRSVPARRRVYEFLFFEPSIPAIPAPQQVDVYRDGGQVCVKSDSALFTFRSGPPLGQQRREAGEYGAYGHSDPANGSFLLYRGGSLLASGPGPVYRRESSLHNVVTFEGQGQIGDSMVWLPDFFPPDHLAPRPEVRTDGRRVSLSVDLSATILPHLGVEKWSRAMVIDLERYIVGVDTVRCREIRTIQWNTHSWESFLPVSAERLSVFALPGGVRLVFLAPAQMHWESGLIDFVPAYPHDGRRDHRLRGTSRAMQQQFIWCYLLAQEPLPAFDPVQRDPPCIIFADGFRVLFDGGWLIPEGFHEDHT